MGENMKKLYWILLLGTFAIDQITKYIIDATMQLGQSIPVIKNFFSITAVHNTGAAWSMFEGQMVLFAI